ncbi:MAG: ABC transporter ATP-binding protein [Roseomonas sp.]|nr:ABC transporter ATP-binding protein [Roseomonas sp.]
MNMQIALRLSGVSKMYRQFKSPAARLREALLRRREYEEFWALRDISFTLLAGRTLGVLGVNGSGKSTLLQIIADVLEPSTGEVEVNGRVAALLELGAGFSPALSGRDNVYTNARILGLSHRSALERLSEVEEFADIGAHFDQPVQTYSSGMFMRVAFAMSICVDPDILIVDEALAVGDAKFQEKCFRRLKEFQACGRTIIFVSHDRATVTQLCDDAILLHGGRLIARGQPADVVAIYTELLTTGALPDVPSLPAQAEVALVPVQSPELASTALQAFLESPNDEDRLHQHPLYNRNEDRFGAGDASILDVLVLVDGIANPVGVVAGSKVEIFVRARCARKISPVLGLILTNAKGVELYGINTMWQRTKINPCAAGGTTVVRFAGRLPLTSGPVFLDVAVAHEKAAGQVEVLDRRCRSLVLEMYRGCMFQGLVDLEFSTEEVDAKRY